MEENAKVTKTFLCSFRSSHLSTELLHRTKWNRHAGQVLRELLEKAAQDDPNSSSTNLEQLREIYKVGKHV